MLQYLRTRDGAVLIDMPDDDDGDALVFCFMDQLHCRLLDLRDRARRRGDLIVVDRLDRINDHDLRAVQVDFGDDFVYIGLRQNGQAAVIDAETSGAQLDLRGRFFAGDIQNPAVRVDKLADLQQQRRFADARLARKQHDRAFDQTAAEYAVEFTDARGNTDIVRELDLIDWHSAAFFRH